MRDSSTPVATTTDPDIREIIPFEMLVFVLFTIPQMLIPSTRLAREDSDSSCISPVNEGIKSINGRIDDSTFSLNN
jgi:hypothetical protein